MNPSQIVNGAELREFNFYADGHIYRGACTPKGLFKLVAEYNANRRTQAFLLAWKLERSGYDSIVSVEDNGVRRVWADLCAVINPIPVIRMVGIDSNTLEFSAADVSSATLTA